MTIADNNPLTKNRPLWLSTDTIYIQTYIHTCDELFLTVESLITNAEGRMEILGYN